MDDAQRLNISCINVVSHSRQSVPPPQIGSQLISAEKFTGKFPKSQFTSQQKKKEEH